MALSRENLERLTNRSTDIVVATDRSGMVIYYNDGAKRSLGYSSEEILGTFVGKLYPSLDEARRVMEALRNIEKGQPDLASAVQTVFLARDGIEIPVAISGTVLHDDRGKEDGSIGYAKDLRDILHKDQLATLGEVAIGLSHEINNPMAVILNQTQLLEGELGELAGERDISVETERLDAIRREIKRVSEVLTRLGEMVEEDTYETIDYAGPARMIDLRKAGDANAGSDPRLGGTRVLVADDDMGIRESLKELLEAWGCGVETATDGAEALEILDRSEVDLIISDVVMPNVDGYELMLAVQKKSPDLPVLMMTAFHYDKDHIIKRSRLKGLKGVLFKKPVDPERLREVMVSTLKLGD
jgi:PAS domain S-box-containing protein